MTPTASSPGATSKGRLAASSWRPTRHKVPARRTNTTASSSRRACCNVVCLLAWAEPTPGDHGPHRELVLTRLPADPSPIGLQFQSDDGTATRDFVPSNPQPLHQTPAQSRRIERAIIGSLQKAATSLARDRMPGERNAIPTGELEPRWANVLCRSELPELPCGNPWRGSGGICLRRPCPQRMVVRQLQSTVLHKHLS
jgi:hypothetical protein